jgi:hypothetical protein
MIVHEGRLYYSVGEIARSLSTTATKVRQMMGCGDRGGGRWSATTYALTRTLAAGEHRDHGEHGPR